MRKLLATLFVLLALSQTVQAHETLVVPGGWYGEARVDRQYAVLVKDSHVQTHAGNIPLPDGINVLFVRVPPTGPFKIAGQDHSGKGNVEWRGSLPWNLVGDSYGVSPVIYDWNGMLHQGALRFGSQGFRYVDLANNVITGDATYADPARRIWEYTTYGDVTVGQGENGCISIRNGDRRMIEPGHCTFLRATRIGDEMALTFVKLLEGRTVIRWLNVNELASFPPETVIEPPNPPDPPKPPQPDCSRGWTPQAPNESALIAQMKEQFPAEWNAMNTVGDLAFIKRVAWALHQKDPRWGLNGKRQTQVLSEDVLVYLNPSVYNGFYPGVEAFDFVIAHGSPSAHVGWLNVTCPMNEGGSGGRWFQPEPVGQKPPPPVDVEQLKQRIKELEGLISGLTVQLTNSEDQVKHLQADLLTLTNERDALQRELEELKNRPEPRCEVQRSGPGWVRGIFGLRESCVVVR